MIAVLILAVVFIAGTAYFEGDTSGNRGANREINRMADRDRRKKKKRKRCAAYCVKSFNESGGINA